MAEIGILGAGSFGGALSIHLESLGHEVTLWSHSPVSAAYINEHHNLGDKLPGVTVPERIRVTSELETAVSGKELLVLAVPSVAIRQTAGLLRDHTGKDQIIVSVAKGLEENSLLRLSEVIGEELPGSSVAILSGPSHAEEVARALPTVLVAGAKRKAVAEAVQNVFMGPDLRVYTSPDLIGIEMGGALKNVIALAAGMAAGLGFGDNTLAALITRGAHEMRSLAVKMGGSPETLAGLTGIGDLIVTCESRHSRNRKCGLLLGQGRSLEEALKEVGMVVEGVNSARAALALSEKYDVTMPIVSGVNKVLFEGLSVKRAVSELMGRDRKDESTSLVWEE